MFCQNCGTELDESAKFCTNCGQKVVFPSAAGRNESNTSGLPPYNVSADNRSGINNATAPGSVKTSPQRTPPPTQVTYNTYNTSQPKKKKGCLSRILTVFAVLLVLSAIGRVIGGNGSSSTSSSNNPIQKTSSSIASPSPSSNSSIKSTSIGSDSTSTSTSKPASTSKPTPAPLFNLANAKTNMKVGEINKDGSWYVGLSAVRATNVLYTAIDWHTVEIPAGQEVIYVLLEVYNDSGKIKSYSSSNLSLYADSNKAADPDTYTLVGIDGYQAYNSNEIDPGTKLLLVDAYLVPIGWKEITVFANDLSWSLTQQDVLRSSYTYATLFPTETPSDFLKYSSGDVIYSKDYAVTYDGCLTYTHNNALSGPENYVVFEFTVNNTSSETLKYNLVGHNMRGYQDLRLLDGATYIMDDNINGYSNVFNVDEIKPGMSARVYVAFELTQTGGLYTCAFDPGYLVNKLLAYVSAAG